MVAEKTSDEMIQEYAATLMKEGFQPEVIAEKFMSLGAGLFETMNGTAATAARLEAAAKALRDTPGVISAVLCPTTVEPRA